MSKPATWMPLYIGDYLADTMALNAEEHGAYLLLIMHYWRNGALPDDDRALAAIARVERKAWSSVGPVVKEFFTVEDGRLHHKRIDKERASASQNSEKKKAAAQARWGGSDKQKPPKTHADAYAHASSVHDECICPSPSPSSSLRSEHPSLRSESAQSAPAPRQPREIAPEIPDWVPVDAWNGFVEMRRKAKKPATPRAIGLLITKLDGLRKQGFDPGEILDQSTASGWSDLYPLKEQRQFSGASSADDRRRASDDAWANVPIIPGT